MDPLLIISPHLDDGILSAGQLMAGRPDTVVVTIFAGAPVRGRMLTTYDRDCGFWSAGHAMEMRRIEDWHAMDALSAARPVWLGMLDQQYREIDHTPAPDPAEIAAALLDRIDELDHLEVLVGPLGLAHPDHILAAEAFALVLAARPELDGWVYEDMPSRVLWPEQVPATLDRWRDRGFTPELGFLGTGDLGAKELALSRYASQLDSLRSACGGNLYPVLVPERHHHLRRARP